MHIIYSAYKNEVQQVCLEFSIQSFCEHTCIVFLLEDIPLKYIIEVGQVWTIIENEVLREWTIKPGS